MSQEESLGEGAIPSFGEVLAVDKYRAGAAGVPQDVMAGRVVQQLRASRRESSPIKLKRPLHRARPPLKPEALLPSSTRPLPKRP